VTVKYNANGGANHHFPLQLTSHQSHANSNTVARPLQIRYPRAAVLALNANTECMHASKTKQVAIKRAKDADEAMLEHEIKNP
jgi:nitrogen-specific signal transduction histidine kinase